MWMHFGALVKQHRARIVSERDNALSLWNRKVQRVGQIHRRGALHERGGRDVREEAVGSEWRLALSEPSRYCSQVYCLQVLHQHYGPGCHETSEPHSAGNQYTHCKNFNEVPSDQYRSGWLTLEDDILRPYYDVTSPRSNSKK